MTGMELKIHEGDCLEVLQEYEDGYFDAVLTDPPYNTTNLPFDKVKINWGHWWQEVHRVCKPTAVIVCFAAQPFTTDLINSNRKNLRYVDVWAKKNAVGFLSANVRPLRAHEDIVVFCRKYGRVKGLMQSTYNPQMTAGKPYLHKSRARPAAHYSATKDLPAYYNEGTRYPTSVHTYGRDVPSLHPTAKPVELLRKLLRSYTHPGERVLDPFAGSGSTGVACRLEGRAFVGVEMDAAYCEVARQRLLEA